MSSINQKFQDTFELTYEAFIQSVYSDLIPLLKELEIKLGKEQTLQIVKPFFEKLFIEWTKGEVKNHPIDSLADFIEYDNTSFPSTLVVSEVKETSENRYLVHVTECLMANVFRDMDAADIGYDIICAPDFTNAPYFNPKLKLSRKMTVMQGHPYYDFLYTWEED